MAYKTYTTSKDKLQKMLDDLRIKNVKIIRTKKHGGGYWLSRGNGQLPLWVRKTDVGNTKALRSHIREVLKY